MRRLSLLPEPHNVAFFHTKIKYQETIISGIDQASNAFIGLFSGENEGKMLVKLAEE